MAKKKNEVLITRSSSDENLTFLKATRLRKVLTRWGEIVGAGVIYMVWVRLTHLGIPCMFHQLTGLLCPGCGISRACLSLSQLDFEKAWNDNRLSLTVVPVLIVYAVYHSVDYIKNGEHTIKIWETVFSIFLLIVIMAYGIIRNIS